MAIEAVKDGGDGNGLKLEKNWPISSSLETLSYESRQKLNTNSFVSYYISYDLCELSGMCELEYLFRFLPSLDRKTVNLA